MSDAFSKILNEHFKKKPIFTTAELFVLLKSKYPDVADITINWKINQLKAKGIITHISRGIYSLNKKNEYTPTITPTIKRIYNKVKKEFPEINLCIWDSNWLNEFMVLQMFRNFIVVETEKDATEFVFNSLSNTTKNVFLNPNKDIFNRYIANLNNVIIVKSLINESPLTEVEGVTTPAIEKLLIDCIIDTILFSAQQEEIYNIYNSAFSKYLVNLNKIRRYARRREKLDKFELIYKPIETLLSK